MKFAVRGNIVLCKAIMLIGKPYRYLEFSIYHPSKGKHEASSQLDYTA